MTVTLAQVKDYYLNVLQRPASDSEAQSWVSVNASGALTDAQVLSSIVNSTEALSNVDPIVRLYQAAFGRVPDKSGLDYQSDLLSSGSASITDIAKGFSGSPEFIGRFGSSSTPTEAFVQALYSQVLGRTGAASEISYWTSGGFTPAQVLYGFAQSPEFISKTAGAISTFLTAAGSGTASYTGALLDPTIGTGSTFTLTAGIDSFTGTSGGDTFNSIITSGLGALDNLSGGAGTDTLNVTDTAAIAIPTSATITGIETANLVSGSTVSGSTAGWTGLTALNISESGGGTITAAATTAVSVTNGATGPVVVNGGAAVTVTTAGGAVTVGGTTGPAGIVTVTESGQAASAIAVDGGTAVSITSTGATTGTITVGATTLPSGAITIARTTTGAVSAGAITVDGGTVVTVTQAASNAVNTTQTNGAVTVNGGALTTSVSVTSAAPATASSTVAGITENTVTISDINSGSATAAGKITTASIDGYTTAVIEDTALTTLSLAHGSGNVIIDNSGLTTPTNTTLGLTVAGLTSGTLDDADIYTRINITTAGTTSSTLTNITTGALTTLTLAGTQGLQLTSVAGLSALQTVTISGAAGLVAASGTLASSTLTSVDASASTGNNTVTINALNATYSGGSGVDSVTTTGAATKAISLGAGDDFLTYVSSTAPTAAINGGAGTADTLVLTAAAAATLSGASTFATNVTGFEHLTLGSATNQTIDLAVLGGYNYVTTTGGNGLTLSNMASGGTLVLNGAGTAYTIGNTAFSSGTADVINLSLTDGSGSAVAFASTGITASGVETFAITTADTQATPSGAFNDTLSILGNSVKTITVAGNAGLILTATSTAATTVDASGITLGGFTYTSGALASAATVKGSATGTNTIDVSAATGIVTYTGGTGADNITANHNKADVFSLGAGNNSVTSSSTTGLTITAGAGNDTVTLSGAAANHSVSLGNGTNTADLTGNTGSSTYIGGTGVDTVTVGSGANTVTTGTGADHVVLTAVTATVNTYTTITDAHATLQLDFLNRGTEVFNATKVTLGSTASFTDYASAVISAGGDSSTNGHLGWFQFGGDTYLVEGLHDGANTPSFINGQDLIVKLTGLVDLSTATASVTGAAHTLTLA